MTDKRIIQGGSPDRVVRLLGPIDPESSRLAIEQLLTLDHAAAHPIQLHLTTPGGCVFSGLSLIDVISKLRSPVFPVGLAIVASMGAVILAAGRLGHRYALPHARVMIHGVWGQSSGKIEEIVSGTRLHLEVAAEVEDLLVAATHMPRAKLRRFMRREQFLSAHEAKTAGLIDHIL
jgi:ATP-dependent Clp protease protease subunit